MKTIKIYVVIGKECPWDGTGEDVVRMTFLDQDLAYKAASDLDVVYEFGSMRTNDLRVEERALEVLEAEDDVRKITSEAMKTREFVENY